VFGALARNHGERADFGAVDAGELLELAAVVLGHLFGGRHIVRHCRGGEAGGMQRCWLATAADERMPLSGAVRPVCVGDGVAQGLAMTRRCWANKGFTALARMHTLGY
jgi:hypothetical protein